MTQHNYIDLHVHSEFSLSDSILRIADIVAHAQAQGAQAIALTDKNNLYGAVRFYRAARKAGIKPIIGCDLSVRDDKGVVTQLVLLVQNHQGFVHLCELISAAYQYDQVNGEVAVNMARLTAQQCQGLIALSGGLQGDIGQMIERGNQAEALARAQHWQNIFTERYYLQIERHGLPNEESYLNACQHIGKTLGLAATASNLACFNSAEDFDIHEARVCISGGYQLSDPSRPKAFSVNHHLLSAEAVNERFADVPVLLSNSVEIAKRCNLTLTLNKSYLPDFPLPDGQDIADYLTELSATGLEARLQTLFVDEDERARQAPTYRQRLALELDVINQMGFPGYFLIVADFIAWAREQAIPVGPGRGSGAGSLVAYALKITDLDPLAYDLLFERFLNPERVSMPDFDIDFCMDKRDLVIDYVADKYGRDKVSQIATFGTMAAKAVIRDVGRVMGMPYPVVDRISKMVPNIVKIKLLDALGRTEKSQEKPEFQSAELIREYADNEESKQLIDTCLRLEGLARNVGKHAGGVVIAPTKLTDFSALYAEEAGAGVSCQFDKDDIETAGLVKFDFLGLRTLTVIDWALAHVNRRRAREGLDKLDIEQVPLDDASTYHLLKSGQTTAVFQLESRGMKELILKLKPDNFEDIIALVALFRPGPLKSGMVDDFINRKHGWAEVEYPHPALEPILNTTYGVMVYQEQVMQVAQVLAQYSLGEADILRRAMGKKIESEMIEQSEIFTSRAEHHGVEALTASAIFDLMAKFAEYGFNKSHSAAYALLSYQTAWLKKHYPAEYLAAVLTSEMDHTDKMVRFVDECFEMGLEVLPPCINRSQYVFSVDESGAIIYGLGAVKGVGEGAIKVIIAEREKNGDFTSLADICQRINLKALNKKTLETLIYGGAFDRLHPNRGGLFAALPEAIRLAQQFHHDAKIQQGDMFGLFSDADNGNVDVLHISDELAWSNRDKLYHEKQTLGLFLSDHPINAVREDLLAMCRRSIADLLEDMERWEKPLRQNEGYDVLVGGLVVDVRKMVSKKGKAMAFVTLDDRSGRCEFGVFDEAVETYQDLLVQDKVLVLKGRVKFVRYRDEWRINMESLYDFEQAKYALAKRLQITVDSATTEDLTPLQTVLERRRTEAGVPISLNIKLTEAAVGGVLHLPSLYEFNAEAVADIEACLGADCLTIHY